MEVISYARINGLPIVDPHELSKDAARLGESDRDWRGLATSINVPRGEEPTIAYVLLSAQVLDKLLETPHDAISLELVVKAKDPTDTTFPGANTLTFPDLFIHSTKAVMSTYGKDDCPYLVELRDGREVAKMQTMGWAGTHTINVLLPDNTWFYQESMYADNGSYVPHSWKHALSETLTQRILPITVSMSYAEAPIFPEENGILDDIPINYRFIDWHPWAAYNRLLHDCGHLYVPAYHGSAVGTGNVIPEVFGGLAAENESLEKARTVSTDKSHARQIVATRVPREIMIKSPVRHWAYQDFPDPEIVSARDHMDAGIVVSLGIQPGSSAGIDGTRVSIVTSTPRIYDSQGTILNEGQVYDVAERTAEAYMASVQDNDQDETFSGLHPLNPTNNIQSVSFFDFGRGFQTKIRNRWIGMDRVQNFQPAHALPDPVVPNIPYHRCVYGKSQGTLSGSSDIPPNGIGKADVYWYKAEGPGQGWKECDPPKQIAFRNAGLGTIENSAVTDTWVYCEFWWQSKEFIAFCGFQEP